MRSLRWIICITILAALFVAFGATGSAKTGEGVVSPALNVLSSRAYMAQSCLSGEELGFSADDFARALNVSSVSWITVKKLPERADGLLYLGGSEVVEGQTISRENLPYLKFVFMSDDIKDSAFCFSSDLGDYEIECRLYSLSYANRAPLIISADVAAAKTYRDVTVFGSMNAYDPDGDSLRYEVISYPQNGSLILLDAATGAYRYQPDQGFAGQDSFRYVAVDRYGNYSQSATVSVTVSSTRTSLVYADLEARDDHVAAIAMTECGVMASVEQDGNYYFYPEQSVTRAEFLAMAMRTLGIEAGGAEKTVFADDGEIPDKLRGFVDVAEKLGYVCGRIDGEGRLVFAPNEPITRLEAAVMIYNMTDVAVPTVSIDLGGLSSVPAWAENAVLSVVSCGILSMEDGCLSTNMTITRGQAAQMLYRLSQLEA